MRCARYAFAWLLPAFSSCGTVTKMKRKNETVVDLKSFLQKTDAKKRTKENNQDNQKVKDWKVILQFTGMKQTIRMVHQPIRS
ncbi:hypothetical protein U9M48_039417 [Paspalum notatum var. saurae]|uniref:Uncharacterized protein n=1 Tax=Paspalum notatum var. saurae TaxID=547442 RepID=A0AAQ3UKP2_PASNO